MIAGDGRVTGIGVEPSCKLGAFWAASRRVVSRDAVKSNPLLVRLPRFLRYAACASNLGVQHQAAHLLELAAGAMQEMLHGDCPMTGCRQIRSTHQNITDVAT